MQVAAEMSALPVDRKNELWLHLWFNGWEQISFGDIFYLFTKIKSDMQCCQRKTFWRRFAASHNLKSKTVFLVRNMDVRSLNAQFWLKNERDCLELLRREWKKVPLLNCDASPGLRNRGLVRFRGMVQDMYDPEFYFEKYEVVNEETAEVTLREGKYTDRADCTDKEVINYDSSKNVTGDRQTYVLVSIPGLNAWVEEVESPATIAPGPMLQKRPLENDDEATESSKRQRTTEPRAPATLSREHLLNFPLPDEAGKTCHLKLYGSSSIKLNEVIECVGFLSLEPLQNVENADDEEQTHNPPARLVPRVHCVDYRRLDGAPHPVLEDVRFDGDSAAFAKKELHLMLTQLLFGDALAAEYLIYHLLSGVYLRRDSMALGKFCLNVSNVPSVEVPDFGGRLYGFLERLVEKSHYLPMTLDNMNDLTFIPKKDYDCNRIASGLLQLSAGTQLTLDETKLTAGKLNESGVRAVAALSDCVRHQRIAYDFNFYRMEYDCDIAVLVLSEGKSLLPSDYHVALRPDDECVRTFDDIAKATEVYLKADLAKTLRAYLSLAKHATYDISDGVQELVQKEFVDMRRNSTTVNADDLHGLLVLARLVCLSEGKGTLDEASWRRACELETERKARL